MKVILLHDVPGLGKPGDVKDVADGYARNYLLPRQLVTAATKSQLATLHERVASAQRRAEQQRQVDEGLAGRLRNVTLTFAVRVGQGDRLYGSVTSQNIADALLEQEDVTIDRRLIQLRDPIRQLGDFDIGIRVARGIEPKIKVRVVSTEAIGVAATASTTTPTLTPTPVETPQETPAEATAEGEAEEPAEEQAEEQAEASPTA
jgi:large subunit ribosomal protein L9